MSRRRLFGSILLFIIVLIISGVFYVYQPHRNITEARVDYTLQVNELITEYLDNTTKANAKYLSDDGQSKVIVIVGVISATSKSADGRDILILKNKRQEVGIQCLFAIGEDEGDIKIGEKIKIKGVLRAGPEYNEDLEMYENGYLEKCSIVNI